MSVADVSRRQVLGFLGGGATALVGLFHGSARAAALATARLPLWRGFNLIDEFYAPGNAGFQEADFDFLAEFGFNFVRIPTDYRIWTKQPGQYDEARLKAYDQMLGWAASRNVHVNLCLHRAPGYCVGGAVDSLDLWGTGPNGDEARRQFLAQWDMLARRYADIPEARLSFNLVNEPPSSAARTYVDLVTAAVSAIRAASPGRIIIADGLSGTRDMVPVPQLAALGIAQSLHAYLPQTVIHYKAGGLEAHETFAPPHWPTENALNGVLYGDAKKAWQAPLRIRHDFKGDTDVQMVVETVSGSAHLVMRADGAVIFDQVLKTGPQGQGDWVFSTSIGTKERPYYQVAYDKAMKARVPAGTRVVSIEMVEGDWMTFSGLRMSPFPNAPGGTLDIVPGLVEKYIRQGEFRLLPSGQIVGARGQTSYGRPELWEEELAPWYALSERGIGVHIGEWGVPDQVPHEVALALMRDKVALYRRAGFGWALWYLRGPWGVLDGTRKDVRYDDWRGHKLDRRMLEILRGT